MSFSGFNLGSSNTPRYGSGVNFDGINTGATFYGQQPSTSGGVDYKALSENIKTLPPEFQGKAFEDLLNRSRSQSNVTELLNFIRETRSPEARKQALEDTLEFQNRQQAAAAPYNIAYKGLDTFSKLPEQISANAANRAMLTVLGAKSVTDAGNAAMANSPFGKGSFVSQVPLSQQRYFS